MTPKEKRNLKALGRDLYRQTGTVDPCLGYKPRARGQSRPVKQLTSRQSKKRIAQLRARGYEVKIVEAPHGALVLRRKLRRTAHRRTR